MATGVIETIDNSSKQSVAWGLSTVYYDGTPMTNAKADGVIYRKKGTDYYKREFTKYLNVKWFGAKGDGITDDTAAIQKAIDVAATSAGARIVWFPQPDRGKFYKCEGSLNFYKKVGVTLEGGGSRMEPTQDFQPTVLMYAGSGSAFIKLDGSRGTTIRGLTISTNNVGFTGWLVDCNLTSGDVTYNLVVEDCIIAGTQEAHFAKGGIHIAGVVECLIQRTNFANCDYGIVAVTAGDTPFATAVSIDYCRFAHLNLSGIAANGIQQGIVSRCVFEPLYDAAGASVYGAPSGIVTNVMGGGGLPHGLQIINNGFWDVHLPGIWIDVSGNSINIENNFFAIENVATAIRFSNGGYGNRIKGNRVIGGAGGTFVRVAVASEWEFNDDGNLCDGGITYITGSAVNYQKRTFGEINTKKKIMTSGDVGNLVDSGLFHARRKVPADQNGGTLMLDREDDTNWRGAAMISRYDTANIGECLMIGVSENTKRPDHVDNHVFKIMSDGRAYLKVSGVWKQIALVP